MTTKELHEAELIDRAFSELRGPRFFSSHDFIPFKAGYRAGYAEGLKEAGDTKQPAATRLRDLLQLYQNGLRGLPTYSELIAILRLVEGDGEDKMPVSLTAIMREDADRKLAEDIAAVKPLAASGRVLPELPFSPYLYCDWLDKSKSKTMYTADQMREYALAATSQQAEGEPVAWRCFHCNEVFADAEQARLHFGAERDFADPACQIDVKEYRTMEARMRAYNDEDAEVHRSMHAMRSKHQQDLMREEEKGYARGLEDGKAYYAAPLPAQPQGQGEPRNEAGETPTEHAHRWATELAISMAKKFFPEITQWKPLPDLLGVITQIDNMTTGLVAIAAASQPQNNRARLINRLQACLDDPMWPDHAEVPKKLLEACLSVLMSPLDGDL